MPLTSATPPPDPDATEPEREPVEASGAGAPPAPPTDAGPRPDDAGVALLSGPSPCPFLVAEGGGWRSPVPDADHRCGAFTPSASLNRQKQARLCLTTAYPTCATYIASVEARSARAGAGGTSPSVGRWSLARTTVTLEPVTGVGVTMGGLLASRRARQTVLALVLIVALAAIASRWGDRDTGAIVSPTPTPTEAGSPVPSTPTPIATEIVITPEPTAAPTPAPTVAPTPTASHQTYTVKSGDTLFVIASRFNTTVKAIMTLNGLSSTTLRVGQVLLIP